MSAPNDDDPFRGLERQMEDHRAERALEIVNEVIAETFSLMSGGRMEPPTQAERDEILRRVTAQHPDAIEALKAFGTFREPPPE